jgi:hypothetical protein
VILEQNDNNLKRQLSFDHYGRYATLRDIINLNKQNNEKPKILDVGGRGNWLKVFMPEDYVYYLEPELTEEDTKHSNFIQGDGCKLPFEDETYDWVTSCDVLEHIPDNLRENFIKEQLRVAKKGIIIAAPFYSPEVKQAEINANSTYKQLTGRDHPWLKEHLDNELPKEDQLLKIINNKYEFQVINNDDLALWQLFIGINFIVENNSTSEIVDLVRDFYYFYNSNIFSRYYPNKSYRKIYYIKKSNNLNNYIINSLVNIGDELFLELLNKASNILCKINNSKNAELDKIKQNISYHRPELYLAKESVYVGDIKKNQNRFKYTWDLKSKEAIDEMFIKFGEPFSVVIINSIRLLDKNEKIKGIYEFETNADNIFSYDKNRQAYFYLKPERPCLRFKIVNGLNIKTVVLDVDVVCTGYNNINEYINKLNFYNKITGKKIWDKLSLMKVVVDNISFNFVINCLKRKIKKVFNFIKTTIKQKACSLKFKKTVKGVYNGTKNCNKRLCIFAHFDPNNRVHDYVYCYLKEIHKNGYDIIFVTTSDIKDDYIHGLIKICAKVIVRSNIGLDFGSWATAIREKPNINQYNEVLLANDSVFGPISNLQDMLEYMRKQNLDVWGCTDSYEFEHHLQSYFIAFNKKVIDSGFLEDFFRKHTVFSDKFKIIKEYEVGLSRQLKQRGFKIGAYCQYKDIASYMCWEGKEHSYSLYSEQCTNSTHLFWDILVNYFNCPFIKRELLVKNPTGFNFKDGCYINNIATQSNYNFNYIKDFIKNE